MSAIKYVQDGPPPGGYPAVRFSRSLPSAGPSARTLFAVATVLMGWGFYKVGQTNKYRRSLLFEKKESRAAIVPYLQAEEDLRAVAAVSHKVHH
ncbi:mitochondrial Complex I (CI) NADH:ubiquinone oxidoreductase subunit B16.6/NB6M/GRIM19/NDUFA13 [Andalucia godoyi]|uniref:NADH dehydrogenase [ubiquinone] 1 alpha subcomplex subunit 13 n=1 Tax=Andalucia godoyi TaxID=505711 RepID=A0A8K0AGN8_ANDGO|nr:mitochondrial Complex I (CI) NADH:ubiquinone oxidoreductase subunit B16.6/NB6M/GRIM19/NDUFA13 [Andalucia godoyi]|eukprot:ANDGO_04018.mRNA.1 mitochondrial Complex I (CI) NADH:ubiquinone oxidoreductase subunit B16.6/NB6M/GRIM19/NDUFA13